MIAFYDAKYTYKLWRPVTAIRATTDPTWTPLSNTAPDPSYPGAHGTISAAGADVLSAVYGNDFAFDVDSTALPGVLRSFVSFTEAAQEASVSRIYNGNHTRSTRWRARTSGTTSRATCSRTCHHPRRLATRCSGYPQP